MQTGFRWAPLHGGRCKVRVKTTAFRDAACERVSGEYVGSMKFRALFAGMGLLASAVAFAEMAAPPIPKPPQSGPAAPSTPAVPTDTNVTKAAPKSDEPAAKKDAAKSTVTKKAPPPAKKKEEPPAKIDGVEIARVKGGFLGLQVVNSNFVLTFYDEKRKKTAPDVVRAGLRWPVKYQPGPERTVLNPGGAGLTSAKNVKPPLNFKVFISLYVEGNEEAVESYSVDYRE